MHRVYVTEEINFVSTLLFYNSSLPVAVPYFLYRFPGFRFRRRKELCNQGETIMLNGLSDETSNSRLSLKYDTV